MADNYVTVILCANQGEINEAVNEWVNVKGYKRLYTAKADINAAHFFKDDAGNWDICPNSPAGKKYAVVFSGN